MPRTPLKTTNRLPKVPIQRLITDWVQKQPEAFEFTADTLFAQIPEIRTCNRNSVTKSLHTISRILIKKIKDGSPNGRIPAIYSILSEQEIEEGLDELAYRHRSEKHYAKTGYNPGTPNLTGQSDLWRVMRIWALEGQIDRAQDPIQAQSPKQLSSESWVLNIVWSILASHKHFKKQTSIGGSLGPKGCCILA